MLVLLIMLIMLVMLALGHPSLYLARARFCTRSYHSNKNMPATPFLIRDALLVRACDLPVKYVWNSYTQKSLCLLEFVRDVIVPHRHGATFLRCLPNMFVLLGKDSSKVSGHATTNDTWDQLLSRTKHKRLQLVGYIALRYILYTTPESGPPKEGQTPFHYVQWIDSLLPGHGIASLMMRLLDQELKSTGVPQDISPNLCYWVKHFALKRDVDVRGLLEGWEQQHGLDRATLKGYSDLLDPVEGLQSELSFVEGLKSELSFVEFLNMPDTLNPHGTLAKRRRGC